MTTIIDHILRPEEFFTLAIVRWFLDANLATSTASAHQRQLGLLATILLSEVSCLQGGVLSSARELLELELVYALCGDERNDEEGGETREEHGGGCEAEAGSGSTCSLLTAGADARWGDVLRHMQSLWT